MYQSMDLFVRNTYRTAALLKDDINGARAVLEQVRSSH